MVLPANLSEKRSRGYTKCDWMSLHIVRSSHGDGVTGQVAAYGGFAACIALVLPCLGKTGGLLVLAINFDIS